MTFDTSSITDQEAKQFIKVFLTNWSINRKFYELVPEDKLDFKMTLISDSPRESIIHQIDNLRDYINAIKNGKFNFKIDYPDLKLLNLESKQKLLDLLDETMNNLVKLLSESDIDSKKVISPWKDTPIPAISFLWGANNHEILHTGWNLAIMDHLGIERFPELTKIWGP